MSDSITDKTQLQRLRASIMAFQRSIAALPADQQSNPHNEQFNQFRTRANALLSDPEFDKKVPRAVTESMAAENFPKVVLPRLSAITVVGVILALAGLGVNSVILETPVVNGIACCVSSGGMLLIMGAFIVLGRSLRGGRLTNLGDLYQRTNTLLSAINHSLNLDETTAPPPDIPNVPSVVELMLDSLHVQERDWQQKLKSLENQRVTLGHNAPMEISLNLDFVQGELARIRREIDRLNGRLLAPDSDAQAEPDTSAADTFAAGRPPLPPETSRPHEPNQSRWAPPSVNASLAAPPPQGIRREAEPEQPPAPTAQPADDFSAFDMFSTAKPRVNPAPGPMPATEEPLVEPLAEPEPAEEQAEAEPVIEEAPSIPEAETEILTEEDAADPRFATLHPAEADEDPLIIDSTASEDVEEDEDEAESKRPPES